MSKDKSQITHKELLTFSNLTNLEWEFVELKLNDENGDKITEEDEEYKELKDLLIPGVFVRKNKEGEIEEYSYLEGIKREEDITEEDLKIGLAEMRQKAGIAMEYKEKLETGNQEGKFLKEWEVVYAADNYKAVADYLDFINIILMTGKDFLT